MTDATALPRIPPRTMEIARLKATGLATKEVAHLLGVTEQTVKNHLSNLYAVLGVSTLEGALYALGWVFPGGLTPEAIAETLARTSHLQSLRVHEALDALIADGLALAYQARATKALLKSDPRAVPKHG